MTINSMLKTLALTSLVALAGTGCDTVKAPSSVRPDELPVGAYPRQVVIDGLDKGIVSAQPIVSPSTAQKPMQITVPLRSVADYPINIQYKFDFLDVNGRPLPENSGWKFANLEPRVQTYLEGNALDNHAADWRLTIRPAR